MEDPLLISLYVTGAGMLILFLALGFLYGLMYLMTAFIKDRSAISSPVLSGGEAQSAREARLRVAAIAVALARAEEQERPVGPPGLKEAASPWRSFHHQRQLGGNRPLRRAR